MLVGMQASLHSHSKRSMSGTCRDVEALLREVGLRPTDQRISLGAVLFAKGNRHITADMLHREATDAKAIVSLATVYNTLRQFADAGLLRRVAVDRGIKYFDTNTSHHHHFLAEGGGLLCDISETDVVVSEMPSAPEGYEIARIDIVVRLRVKNRA
jgi:Fur family transcriptional regulator, iron response regulator